MEEKINKLLKLSVSIVFILLAIDIVNAEEVKVVRIVDGDTIKVKYSNNRVSSVRLAGIDTPESYLNSKAKKDISKCKVKDYIMIHLGLSAKDYLKSILPVGSTIRIKIITKGRYKRNVVYIKSIQERLVINGYAVVKSYNGHDKDIVKKLLKLQDKAKSDKRLLWSYLSNNCF